MEKRGPRAGIPYDGELAVRFPLYIFPHTLLERHLPHSNSSRSEPHPKTPTTPYSNPSPKELGSFQKTHLVATTGACSKPAGSGAIIGFQSRGSARAVAKANATSSKD